MRVPSWGVAVLLIATVAAAHAGALDGGFHYDDRVTITENLAIRTWQPLFYVTSPLAVSSEPGSAGYRPLTVASFAANYALGRLDPFGYLLGNLLLHLALSWMVFLVGRALLEDDRWAAVAAVIYALHPVNAEAMNYAAARSSLLATLGMLVAWWAFAGRQAGGGVGWTVAGATAFLVALLSKESAAALLPVLATHHWAHRATVPDHGASRVPSIGRWIRPVIPYVIIFVGYVAIWWTVAGGRMEHRGSAAVYPAWTLIELVGRSLWLWLWPWPLGLDHPLTFTTQFDATLAVVLVIVVSGLAGSVVVARRRHSLVAWCVVWVLAGLAPLAPLPWLTVKGLLQENRLAFSAVALAWLTAVAIRALAAICAKRMAGWSLMSVGLFRGLVVAVSVAGIASTVAVDRARSAVWNDDVRLWEEAVRLSPASRSAHLNLGASLMGRGEDDAAEREFRLALDLAPGEAHAYYALGRLALRRERLEEARDWLEQAIARAPEYSGSYHALGDVAMKLRDPAADVSFRRALALNPRDAKALAKLGLLAQQTGDRAAAEAFYRAALAQDPDHVVARNNLGILYIQRRDWLRAFEQFAAAARRDPDDLDAVYNEAITLDMLGRKDEARAILKRLLARLPPDPKFDSHRRGAQTILHQARP